MTPRCHKSENPKRFFQKKKRDENAAQARRDAKANGKFSKEQLAESGKAPDGTKPKMGGQFVKGSTRAERKRAAIASSKGRGGASSSGGAKRPKLSKNQKSRLL